MRPRCFSGNFGIRRRVSRGKQHHLRTARYMSRAHLRESASIRAFLAALAALRWSSFPARHIGQRASGRGRMDTAAHPFSFSPANLEKSPAVKSDIRKNADPFS
jgi:hypothetical protein